MRKAIILILVLFSFRASCFAQDPKEIKAYPRHIVSLSPSITEMLYEIGLGDKVVGVTDYCNYPEDVKEKFRVGGYLNTNYEAIVFIRPDFVISQSEPDSEVKKLFESTGIEYMTVNTETLNDIFDAMIKIGVRCGAEDGARRAIERMSEEIAKARKSAEGKGDRRIMVVIGRSRGSFENIYIAGKKTFYDDIIEILGCKNVYSKSDMRYPTLSEEAVMRLDPDIIIEMVPGCSEEEKAKIGEEWKSFGKVSAVKNNRVYVLNGDYVSIPGPRFILTLKDIQNIL